MVQFFYCARPTTEAVLGLGTGASKVVAKVRKRKEPVGDIVTLIRRTQEGFDGHDKRSSKRLRNSFLHANSAAEN